MEKQRLPGAECAEDYFNDLLKEHNPHILVAIENDKVVGLCSVIIEHEKNFISPINDYAYITDVVVAKNYRKKGIASELVSAIENWVRSKNIKFILATVLTKNNPSEQLFTRNGFRKYEMELLKEL